MRLSCEWILVFITLTFNHSRRHSFIFAHLRINERASAKPNVELTECWQQRWNECSIHVLDTVAVFRPLFRKSSERCVLSASACKKHTLWTRAHFLLSTVAYTIFRAELKIPSQSCGTSNRSWTLLMHVTSPTPTATNTMFVLRGHS